MAVVRVVVFFFSIFFFQAEDGIRDLVRSRGLGDVYKRQVVDHLRGRVQPRDHQNRGFADSGAFRHLDVRLLSVVHHPVSYTHLTLPTSDLV